MIYVPHRRKAFRVTSSIPSPQHHWQMNAASGNESDTGVGTARTMTSTGTTPASVTGKIGNARDGNATGYFVTVDDSDFDLNGADRTVAFWFKADAHNNNVAGKHGASGQYAWYFYTIPGGNIYVGFSPNGTSLSHSINGGTTSTGTWYQVILTWTDSTDTAELFINNVSKGTTVVSGGVHNSTAGFQLHSAFNAASFNGAIDSVSTFNSVIDTTARAELYNSGSGKDWNGSAWV